MNSAVISVSHLSKHFHAARAVDDVSFQVEAGSVFGFLGPNGAGKTTTIRLLLGLVEPTGGNASVFGHDVIREGDEVRRRTGALLEYSGLYERLSAEDNLTYYARIWRMNPSDRKKRIHELLDHFGLLAKKDERAGSFSRGMKQKLAIARVLLHRPQLIFLDEPTAGLDPVAAASLREDIGALAAKEGATIFMTTHNLHEAERLCTHLAVMNRGKLVASGKTDELLTGDGGIRYLITGSGFTGAALSALEMVPEARVLSRTDGGLEVELSGKGESTRVVRALIEAGACIDEVKRSRASLEDLFLTLMEENHAV